MTDELQGSAGIDFIKKSSLARATIRDLIRFEAPADATGSRYASAPFFDLPRSGWRLNEARIQPLLQQRRSLRRYSSEPFQLADLAFILWACQGVTARAGSHLLRTSPSAGALYPVETYLSIHNVEGLEAGLYYFEAQTFRLALLAQGDRGIKLSSACLDQHFIAQSAFTFIWTGSARKCMAKYGERGMRYLFLDAAHICQSSLVAAEAIKAGGCPVAAFYDDELSELIGIDGVEEIPLYLATIGLKL